MSDLYDELDDYNIRQTVKNLSPLKQRIAIALADGSNFNKIGREEHLKPSRIYKIKEELQNDLMWLKQMNCWHEEETFEDQLFEIMRPKVSAMKLSRFADLYLRDYCDINFNSIKQWENYKVAKDRIIVAITLIVRELFVRSKPIVIDYYYSDRKSLVDLIQRFKVVVKNSPVIHDRLDVLHTDADLGIRLRDSSQVRAIWTEGRQPTTAGTVSIFDENKSEIQKNIPRISYV